MNEAEKKIVKIIEEFGCHVTTVFDPEGEDSNFSYSTGIKKTYEAPEIIVVGLTADLGQSVVNNYAGRLKKGEKFEINKLYSGFLSGFDITFGDVSQTNKEDYMISSSWFNNNCFEAIQLIYPTVKGIWPWDKEASENFHNIQPCLAEDKAW